LLAQVLDLHALVWRVVSGADLHRTPNPANLPQRHSAISFSPHPCPDSIPPSSPLAIAPAWMTCACSPGPSLHLSPLRAAAWSARRRRRAPRPSA